MKNYVRPQDEANMRRVAAQAEDWLNEILPNETWRLQCTYDRPGDDSVRLDVLFWCDGEHLGYGEVKCINYDLEGFQRLRGMMASEAL